MAISRGMYGQAGKITLEYFIVEARIPNAGCYSDLIASPTKNMAYVQMVKKYKGCKITLYPCSKERYWDEMAQTEYWNKNAGGARGPEPVL